jgi:hypothetical protein
MLTQLILSSLSCLGICSAICIAATKRTIPITIEDANVMWTLHKQNSRCKCKHWSLLKPQKGRVNGFQCECGYKYTQKKSIIN